MKKVLTMLALVVLMFAFLTGCILRPSSSSSSVTTESEENTYTGQDPEPEPEPLPPVDRSLLSQVVIGETTLDELKTLLGRIGSDADGNRWVTVLDCTDGTNVYIVYRQFFDENGQFDLEKSPVITAITDTLPEEPQLDPALFDRITVGMTPGEVYAILGTEGRDIGSGMYIAQYLCSDGRNAVIHYRLDVETDRYVVESCALKQG